MTLILGLESSCDETAAAVVADGVQVRSNVVWSQHALHERYLGVVPEIASRAHLERLTPVVEQALAEAGCGLHNLDAIAVGNRPGLIGSLIVAVAAAKTLAWSLGKPLIGIDHVEAHLWAASLIDAGEEHPSHHPGRFPALGLVVSGGHTSLYDMAGPTQLRRIGSTIDDAVGEAYDKAANILGVGYPGGPRIDKLAQQGDASHIEPLPQSTLDRDSLDFSFSGLKTALLYRVRGQPVGRGKDATFERCADDLSDTHRADLAAAFQHAAVGVLITKLGRAIEQLDAQGRRPQRVILGGGVSANSLLRTRIAEVATRYSLPAHIPKMRYCVDNAAMVAGLAHAYHTAGHTDTLDLPAIATTRH